MDTLSDLRSFTGGDKQTYIQLVCAAVAIFLATLQWLLSSNAEQAVNYDAEVPEQCRPGWKGKELDEPSTKVTNSTAVQCYCPTDGQSLGIVNPVTADGIDRLVNKAREAQLDWAATTFSERRRVLRTILKYVLSHQDAIAQAACLDSGKTQVDALFGEILVTAEKLKWTIDHGEKALRPSSRPTNLLMIYKANEVRYEPLGVVAACVSWNYPFHNLIGPIISSLFTGNAIIVKNSENTAWSAAYFTSIVRGALTACGHSPNLVHAITCWPKIADYLTSHPGISHLTFIGSRPVAHAVCTSAARSLTPVTVELGGKDAAIILDSPTSSPTSQSEMNRIASILMRGVFQSAGQNCIGVERIIAMPQSYSRLISMLETRIASLRVGNALIEPNIDVGAMISNANFSRLENLISDAVSHGARLLCGGKRLLHPKFPKGHYFTPTLLVDVTPEMRIAREELFAPIAVFMRAESVSAVISIANSTPYGLGSSVFGPSSASKDLERVTREVQAGMVAVNDFAAFYAVQLPFGGVKGSGYGRFAGEEGLRGLCNIKSVCRDRFWGIIKTRIPGKLDYPVGQSAWEMGKGVVELGYGESIARRVRGLRRMAGL